MTYVEEMLQISKDKFKEYLTTHKITKDNIEDASIDFKNEFVNIVRACEEREELTKQMKKLGLDNKSDKISTPTKVVEEKVESPVMKTTTGKEETSSPVTPTKSKPSTPTSTKSKLEEMKRQRLEQEQKKKDSKKKTKEEYV